MSATPIEVDACAAGVRVGRRAALARALTLVESTRPADREPARQLLRLLTPHAGRACRIGISGVPGAGKSTFIDALGRHLTAHGLRVAVLAVDPSSQRTGGSILGDRTRMARLAAHPAAFIRPSSSAGRLGGVTRTTHDAIVVVEAAGYDVVLIETVGVGQSETAVADLVDAFLLLVVPGTGDELQALKMGILERADLIAVNKDDGANRPAAGEAAQQLRSAIRLMRGTRPGPAPTVLTCSAVEGSGIPEVWRHLRTLHEEQERTGARTERRAEQRLTQLHVTVRARVLSDTYTDPAVAAVIAQVEADIRRGGLTTADGAEEIAVAVRRHARRRSRSDDAEMQKEPQMSSDADKVDRDDIGVIGIDHVGIAVVDLDEAIDFHARTFGMRCVAVETNVDQGVREAMLQVGDSPAGATLQLLAPLSVESPIARFLERRGPGMQQIAYTVVDIDRAAATLADRGVSLLWPTHRRGAGGSLVNFVHPRDAGGVLVELVEHPTQGDGEPLEAALGIPGPFMGEAGGSASS